MANPDVSYALLGNRYSDQAEQSTSSPGAASTQMRILIELQVIAYLLHQSQGGIPEDLRMLRQNFADSIT